MRKKRILAAIAILLMCRVPDVGAESVEASPHTHVSQELAGHWAEEKILSLLKDGVIIGGGSGRLYPDKLITRAELVTLFLRSKGIHPERKKQVHFADVPPDHWFYPYAETAYRLGIIHGQTKGDGLYLHPDEHVNKQELITMLLRARGDGGRINQLLWSTTMQTLLAYPDRDQVSDWSKRPMVYALQNGITKPSSDGTLEPTKPVTRAAAAVYAFDFLYQPDLSKEWNESASAASFRYTRTLEVETTAYNYPNSSVKSFIGWPLRPGIVAVDPNVIALGSHLYIEGYGYGVAADIGGAIKGNRIDLYLPTYQQALQHGIKEKVKVYVLD
ncbi:MAG: S-layer homology domain-containing protein [Brevibacillus sp.]|nr:S-layer homology domain-containing protein [Brevibacillus sp.]